MQPCSLLQVSRILSQNVGPNCPLSLQALQGEHLHDCNPGLGNPQLQMNNLFLHPPNGLAPGPTALECQRSAFQDRICTQCQPNLPANVVPIPQSSCTNLGPLNTQILQCSSCTGPPGPSLNIPGPLLPFNQPFLPQDQCPIGAAIRPCLPQQNLGLLPFEMFPPESSLLSFNQGMLPGPCQTLTGQQGTSLCQQVDSSLFPDGVSFLNNFSPLLPTVNPGFTAPCTDMLPPLGIVSTFTPLIPLNNQGAVDVFHPGNAQCSSALNGPSVDSLSALSNRLPIQTPTLPASQINCLSQGPGFVPQCDVIPEPCFAPDAPCPPAIGSTLQNSLPFSPLNMFRFPRPTLFPSAAHFQGPLNNLPSSCEFNCAASPTPNQGSVCASPALIQQEPIFGPQIPIAPATFVPKILPGMQSSFVPQPTVNSGPCSLTTDVGSIHALPSPIIHPQSCNIPPNGLRAVLPQVANSVDCPPITPINISPSYLKDTVSLLPTPCNIRCDSSGLFPSAIANNFPIPINLEINVPPPVIPAPMITIINTLPASEAAVSAAGGDSSFNLPYPMPPLIIEGRRSSSRSWLPLVLVALIARDGDGYGGGCLCDSGPIPIPFPIPIPTNNPVIVNK